MAETSSTQLQDLLLHPERWTLVSSACPPGVSPARNKRHQDWYAQHCDAHSHREVMLVLEGNGYYGFQENIYPLSPGTIFLFAPFEAHQRDYPPFSAKGTHLWVNLVPGHIHARILRLTPKSPARYTASMDFWITEHDCGLNINDSTFGFGNMPDLPAPIRRGRQLSALGMLCTALAAAIATPREERPDEAFQQSIIDAIVQHIRQTAGAGTSLETLARVAGYSKFHFLRLFKHHTGKTVQAYIDTCRKETTRELLEKGYSKKDIAERLGFSCPAAFSRWARKHMEETVHKTPRFQR